MTALSTENIGAKIIEDVAQFEDILLSFPQVECPVEHLFGPGIYIRQVWIPAGTLALGHRHIKGHVSILLSGSMVVAGRDGSTMIIRAPATFLCEPGRKLAYAIEDTIWQNIYATELTDIAAIEEDTMVKSEQWRSALLADGGLD